MLLFCVQELGRRIACEEPLDREEGEKEELLSCDYANPDACVPYPPTQTIPEKKVCMREGLSTKTRVTVTWSDKHIYPNNRASYPQYWGLAGHEPHPTILLPLKPLVWNRVSTCKALKLYELFAILQKQMCLACSTPLKLNTPQEQALHDESSKKKKKI